MVKKLKRFFNIPVCILVLIMQIQASGYSQGKQNFTTIIGDQISIERQFNLPELLHETSGLVYFRGLAWTFNDSGGEPELFAYSMTDSAIVQCITLWNGKNYDWEDITQDSTSIYAGDFGNNFGIRNNLCIYKIDKSHIPSHGNKIMKASKIHFTYPDYQPILFTLKHSAWDCEAMIWFCDSLYLFTKNWITQTSSIYQLSDKPGRYLARKIGEFDSKGLSTGADFSNGTLFLIGYHNWIPCLWKFENRHNMLIKTEEGKRYDLKALSGKQTEGIAIINANTLLISAEETSTPPQLFVVRIKPKVK